jgi:hypothetical protein
MTRYLRIVPFVLALGLLAPASGHAGLAESVKCQKSIAKEGARFALRVLRSNLRCTEGVSDCQIQCDLGVYGPPCETSPPPCCDPDDPSSNSTFAACMAEADEDCNKEAEKRIKYETSKVSHIIAACTPLTQEELCGAQAVGLNFAQLNAGCLALDPNYTCNVTNLVACVGGPLERQLLDQITFVLHPRSGDAVAALNLQSQFPDVPVARKVKGQVAEGKVDLWRISGEEGDQVVVRLVTRDDNGNSTSNLHPVLEFLSADATTAVADTNVRSVECAVPNVCGSSCPQFKRTLPFNGNFFLAVQAFAGDSCTGGRYRLVVTSPGGSTPVQVADDIDPPPGF